MSAASAPPADRGLGLAPPRARGGTSGGIFSYWFGTSSLRADPSDVFAGLVYRLRARDAAFTPHELTLLKQCETDVQVRAVTAGYVTGAGTHSALGFVSKRAPRLMLSALAGACGAYAGVQSMARDCMRRVARLEDSQLAADARFVIRQLAPHDLLGREPAGESDKSERTRRDGAGTAAAVATGDGGGALLGEVHHDASSDGAAAGESADVARLEMRGDDFFSDASSSSSLLASSSSSSFERERDAHRDAHRGDASRDGRTDAARAAPFATRATRFIPRDAFGDASRADKARDDDDRNRDDVSRNLSTRSKRVSRDDGSGASRSGAEASAARRRAAAEAARARRRDRADAEADAARGSDGALAKDELRDPAPRVSFDRGTRRTSYGDVLDR